MDHFNLQRDQFKLDVGYDVPRILNSVMKAAALLHPGLATVLAADELLGIYAPDMCDWTGVEDGLPEDAYLLLTFNPGWTTKPLKLPSSPAFHHVVGELGGVRGAWGYPQVENMEETGLLVLGYLM